MLAINKEYYKKNSSNPTKGVFAVHEGSPKTTENEVPFVPLIKLIRGGIKPNYNFDKEGPESWLEEQQTYLKEYLKGVRKC